MAGAKIPLDLGRFWILQALSTAVIMLPVILNITILLRFISGVPLFKKSALKKYGSTPEYQDYLARTRLLVRWPPKSNSSNSGASTAKIPTVANLSDKEFTGRWKHAIFIKAVVLPRRLQEGCPALWQGGLFYPRATVRPSITDS